MTGFRDKAHLLATPYNEIFLHNNWLGRKGRKRNNFFFFFGRIGIGKPPSQPEKLIRKEVITLLKKRKERIKMFLLDRKGGGIEM